MRSTVLSSMATLRLFSASSTMNLGGPCTRDNYAAYAKHTKSISGQSVRSLVSDKRGENECRTNNVHDESIGRVTSTITPESRVSC
ncbi:hypothetical protein EV363DRAFT_1356748, partial [Boletus edulis]